MEYLIAQNIHYDKIELLPRETFVAMGLSGELPDAQVVVNIPAAEHSCMVDMNPGANVEHTIQDFVRGPGSQPVTPYVFKRIEEPPVSMRNEQNLEALAFPWLYPDGANHVNETVTRVKPVTKTNYVKTRLHHWRGEFEKDINWVFFWVSLLQHDRLFNSVQIALTNRTRIGKFGISSSRVQPVESQPAPPDADGNFTDIEHFRVKDLLNSDVNPDIQSCSWSFMRNIRGTPAYWYNIRETLYCFMENMGPASWYLTLSANDLNWVDMAMALDNTLTLADAKRLTRPQRQKLLNENPVRASRWFAKKVRAFLNDYLRSADNPLGKVDDWFVKIEFQARGSPHAHILLWCSNPKTHAPAPDASTLEGQREALKWVQKCVTAAVPGEGCPDLRNIVQTCQKHRCKTTCFKSGRKKCRFRFPPGLPQESNSFAKTFIVDCGGDGARLVDEARDDPGWLQKGKFYKLERRSVEEVYTNPYPKHPAFLKLWRGNVDLQYVGSMEGTIHYLCNYFCKAETKHMRESVYDAIRSLPANANQWSKLLKIGHAIFGMREMSAQEHGYFLCGKETPLYMSSRNTLFVDTVHPQQKVRRPVRMDQQPTDLEGKVLFQDNVRQRYIRRPTGPTCPLPGVDSWDDMNLINFASHFNFCKKKRTGDAECWPLAPDQNGLNSGFLYLRPKPLLIRTTRRTAAKHGDSYYYGQLMLYKPWRSFQELQGEDSKAETVYLANAEQLKPWTNRCLSYT